MVRSIYTIEPDTVVLGINQGIKQSTRTILRLYMVSCEEFITAIKNKSIYYIGNNRVWTEII